MLVREFMSSALITITNSASLHDAQRLMRAHRCCHLPVVDEDGRLVGLLSARDVLYSALSHDRSISIWELHRLFSKVRVCEIMTDKVMITTPDASIEDAARRMAQNQIGCLPVIDQELRAVGIITLVDVLRALVESGTDTQAGLHVSLGIQDGRDLWKTVPDSVGS